MPDWNDRNDRKHELKPLSAAAVPRSIEKAERYRLINQPWAAESICLDILRTEPGNQRALHALVLALTDQFTGESGELARRAQEALAQVTSEYERAYYSGMILERRATAKLASRTPGAGFIAYEWVRAAMESYEKAERLKPAGNDDAILRWNSCVRMMSARPELRPAPQDLEAPVLGE
jgi:hypothetical protein